jgi:hypothetical protein
MHVSQRSHHHHYAEKTMPKSTHKILLGRPTLFASSTKSINVQTTLEVDARGDCSLETSPESATHFHVCFLRQSATLACCLRFATVDPSLTTRLIGASTRLLVNLATKTVGSNINADLCNINIDSTYVMGCHSSKLVTRPIIALGKGFKISNPYSHRLLYPSLQPACWHLKLLYITRNPARNGA